MACETCAAAFTPGGYCAADPSDLDAVSQCDRRCRGLQGAPPDRLPFCGVACADPTSTECGACASACTAACLCTNRCSGFALDAGRCLEQGGRWLRKDRNFDSFFQGMRTLFEISTRILLTMPTPKTSLCVTR